MRTSPTPPPARRWWSGRSVRPRHESEPREQHRGRSDKGDRPPSPERAIARGGWRRRCAHLALQSLQIRPQFAPRLVAQFAVLLNRFEDDFVRASGRSGRSWRGATGCVCRIARK